MVTRSILKSCSREGRTFAFAEELEDKRRQVREVEEALASSARDSSDAEDIAA